MSEEISDTGRPSAADEIRECVSAEGSRLRSGVCGSSGRSGPK
jgi:hypothetical protein